MIIVVNAFTTAFVLPNAQTANIIAVDARDAFVESMTEQKRSIDIANMHTISFLK